MVAETPLYLAVRDKQKYATITLIKLGADKVATLRYTIRICDTDSMVFILRYMTNNEIPDNLMHYAAKYDQDGLVVYSLARLGYEVNKRTLHGFTALHRAAFTGTYECCAALIAEDADINARSDNGQYPLGTAIARFILTGKTDVYKICDLLMDYCADPLAPYNGSITIKIMVGLINDEGLTKVFKKYV